MTLMTIEQRDALNAVEQHHAVHGVGPLLGDVAAALQVTPSRAQFWLYALRDKGRLVVHGPPRLKRFWPVGAPVRDVEAGSHDACLQAIDDLSARLGVAPTYAEIAQAMGEACIGRIYDLVSGLAARGLVMRRRRTPRLVEVHMLSEAAP